MNNKNPFRRDNNPQDDKAKKAAEWGKVKFNPVAKTAVTEAATPWSQFKSDLIKQQQDETQELKLKNNPNAQEILKIREQNYRRELIKRKRNEPIQWEDFSEETPQKITKYANNNEEKLQQKNRNIKEASSMNNGKPTLTRNQNNFLKKAITKTTMQVKGSSFKSAVESMKLYGVKKNKKDTSNLFKNIKKKY